MPSLKTIVAAATITLIQTTQAWNIELPSCIDEFQPFVYSGCFKDSGSQPALIYRSSQSMQDMTVEKCVAECKGNGFRYAGLKYYGVCYCGHTVVGGAQLDESECNLPCSGDNNEICGGNNQLSVWADPTFPTGTRSILDYQAAGCYSDDSNKARALSWPMPIDSILMTPALCLAACQLEGFPLAGLEYGGECWCGNVLANGTRSVPDSDCSIPCKGDILSKCGGSNRLNLYIAKDMQSLQPCGWQNNPSPSVVTSSTTTVTTSQSVSTSSTSVVVPVDNGSSSSSSSTTSTSVATSTSTSTSALTSTTTTKAGNGGFDPVGTPVSPTSTTTTSRATTTTTSTSVRTTTMSTSTTSAAMCTSTVVVPNDCEYKCGNWCAPSLPDFQDQDSCLNAFKTCSTMVTSCFKSAGWPGALDCFDFSGWCGDIKTFCQSSSCKGRQCAKKDCLSKNKPQGGNAVKTTTSVFPCAATTSSTPPAAATSVAPDPTNICQQPSSNKYNYGPGNPVAGIEIPLVACNDLKSGFSQRPLKLYDDQNSSKCRAYSRTQAPNACADACKAQYDSCQNVYVESCKRLNGKSYFAKRELEKSGIEKRWFNRWGGDGWLTASSRCVAQYYDCLDENKKVDANSRCRNWGQGN